MGRFGAQINSPGSASLRAAKQGHAQRGHPAHRESGRGPDDGADRRGGPEGEAAMALDQI